MSHKRFFFLFCFSFYLPTPSTKVVTCDRREATFVSSVFFTIIPYGGMQVLHGGQLTVNHLICLFWKAEGGRRWRDWVGVCVHVCVCVDWGGRHCDGWFREARPEKLDPIVSYQGGRKEKQNKTTLHESASIWSINITVKGWVCIAGVLSLQRSPCGALTAQTTWWLYTRQWHHFSKWGWEGKGLKVKSQLCNSHSMIIKRSLWTPCVSLNALTQLNDDNEGVSVEWVTLLKDGSLV